MAKGTLLNTETASYLDLVGNGRTFYVPKYQRDYSWTQEQWEDLWNDVLDLHDAPDDRHYMGAVVLEAVAERPDREFWIIDGQQRFVTLSLFVLAVVRHLDELAAQGVDVDSNQQRAAALRSRFVGEKDLASLVETSKLRLNETDDGFYQDYLIQLREPTTLRSWPRSCQLLWSCFDYFGARIAEQSFAQDGPSLARLISESLARQLLFTRITVDDELSAFTVFETLNARGLELSATDLIKNYLFSRIRAAGDLTALQRRWARLIGTVSQERFPEFLRYHMLCGRPRVRSQRLFKIVRDEVREPDEVFRLMEALEERAELFAALGDPTHEMWIDRPECRSAVTELNTFRVKQMTPLLFAAWERSPDVFDRILHIVAVVSFRYSVVGKRNSNDLEPVYHGAARAVLDGRATNPADVFRCLEAIYVDDRSFESEFRGFELRVRGPGKKLARYVLARLEADASGRDCDPGTDGFTVEHVLPENPSDSWLQEFPESRIAAFVHRLGNLIPLEPAANRDIGNAGFEQKVARYAQSRYELARALGAQQLPGWSPTALENRQIRLADRAKHIWRLDYT